MLLLLLLSMRGIGLPTQLNSHTKFDYELSSCLITKIISNHGRFKGACVTISLGVFWTTSTHTYLDSGTPAFSYGIGYGGTWRIDHGHKANKAEAFQGEVNLIGVKCKSLGECIQRQEEVAETWRMGEYNSRYEHLH